MIQARSSDWNRLPLDRLTSANGVAEAGQLLMQQPSGWTEITGNDTQYDTLWIVIHGYGSRGYEWVDAITAFSATGKGVFFYRYDWSQCPAVIVPELASQVNELVAHFRPNLRQVLIFGHSYGALIAAELNPRLDPELPLQVHAIAGPLAGMKGFQGQCPRDSAWIDLTSKTNTGNRLTQWRTVQSEDGAYRKAAVDPQVVDIPGSTVIQLPKTMDGHRLGHNWSVKWVAETFLGLRDR